jgi:hypothetical protein
VSPDLDQRRVAGVGLTLSLAIAAMTAACGAAQTGRPTTLPERGELVVRTADGREHRSAGLVGALLDLGDRSVRIERVTSEVSDGQRVWLHHMVVLGADGTTSELCVPDARGERWVLAVRAADGGTELTCTSGAVGKCIRWGYAPDVSRAAHAACVRMVRADYGGDDQPWTRDGTMIAFCDRAGIHPCRGDELIEAAWTPAGATCVARTRILALLSMPELARRYPRLARGGRAACTVAQSPDAILFDWQPPSPKEVP